MADQARSGFVSSLASDGFYKLHYREWGDPNNPKVLICAHGLTRNATDFDSIAAALADEYRVFCVDYFGRGKSDWLRVKTDYQIPTYVAATTALIARTGAEQIDWVGTSMGGLIGMSIACMPGNPIRKMVINDVGTELPADAMRRIAEYLQLDFRFDTLQQFEAYLRQIHAPFGPLTDEQWQHLAENGYRILDDGKYTTNFDPEIAAPFRAATISNETISLWPLWDAIQCSTLLLRGADSDVLPADIAQQMTQRGPKAELKVFAGMGHAPALMAKDQIATVRDWLLGD
jgi:pimeloyl-ACP methyl ester carboxylesterase